MWKITLPETLLLNQGLFTVSSDCIIGSHNGIHRNPPDNPYPAKMIVDITLNLAHGGFFYQIRSNILPIKPMLYRQKQKSAAMSNMNFMSH